jgi:hypothetical protein
MSGKENKPNNQDAARTEDERKIKWVVIVEYNDGTLGFADVWMPTRPMEEPNRIRSFETEGEAMGISIIAGKQDHVRQVTCIELKTKDQTA